MEAVTESADDAAMPSERSDVHDFSFLPSNLTAQCRSLIESYHDVHGFACLPDILWKSGLGPFIERHQELRQHLRRASTTRSAKKSNEGFVHIAATILSLEILASSFAGWSAIYPRQGAMARAVLKQAGRGANMPLMDFYLYPPKYLSSAAVATLALPQGHQPGDADLYRASKPELIDEKLALNFVSRQASDNIARHAASAPMG